MDSHYLSRENPAKSKPMKETSEKLWHPADCKHQRNSSGKSRDNKKKRGPTNPQQKKRL